MWPVIPLNEKLPQVREVVNTYGKDAFSVLNIMVDGKS